VITVLKSLEGEMS